MSTAVADMTTAGPVVAAAWPGPNPLPAEVRDAVRADCGEVDRGHADLRPLLRRLASSGLADLGAPGSPGTLLDQARVIEALARSCLASAFTLWAHRMTVHYLALRPVGPLRELGDQLRCAERTGSTAMAGAFRDLAGIAELPVTFQRTASGLVLEGVVAWASNLYDDAVVVTAARHATTGERVVVALQASAPGLAIDHTDDLLALGSTRSGSLRLHRVEAPADHVLTNDLPAFVRQVRPVFLVLQSAFCLGLAGASLAASPEPTGVQATFAAERDERFAELARLGARLVELAEAAGTPREPAARAYLQLRLDAGHLARAATELELCLTGGRGYVATSPTARRVREALFLPVQSPTEGQLRWELARSA